jgi:hypothetical protein
MESSRRTFLRVSAAGAVPLILGAAQTPSPPAGAGTADTGHVSVLGFIDPARHAGILDGTTTSDVSRELQSAIDSGENLFFPGSGTAKYIVDGRLQMTRNYQRLFSDGWVRLDLRGTDPAANGIELLSTRRDRGDASATREAQALEGFRLTGPASARYASLIFVEEGTFAPSIQRILSAAGTDRGYFGALGDAFIRVNGNARSYVNDVTIRDCTISGIANPRRGGFPPCGIWIEGAIEGRIENTKLFYFDECMRLGDPAGRSRNVQHMVFDQVQMEPTKPTQVVDSQASLAIYYASACTFRDCRLDPGNGAGSENSVAVRVSPGGPGAQQVRFRDCSFQGMRHARNLCRVVKGAVVRDMVFSGGDIRGFTGKRVIDETGAAQITFGDDVFADASAAG